MYTVINIIARVQSKTLHFSIKNTYKLLETSSKSRNHNIFCVTIKKSSIVTIEKERRFRRKILKRRTCSQTYYTIQQCFFAKILIIIHTTLNNLNSCWTKPTRDREKILTYTITHLHGSNMLLFC